MIHNIILFITVMLLTVGFIYKATASAAVIVEPRQDLDNVCYLTDTCKPTGSMDNPFNS